MRLVRGCRVPRACQGCSVHLALCVPWSPPAAPRLFAARSSSPEEWCSRYLLLAGSPSQNGARANKESSARGHLLLQLAGSQVAGARRTSQLAWLPVRVLGRSCQLDTRGVPAGPAAAPGPLAATVECLWHLLCLWLPMPGACCGGLASLLSSSLWPSAHVLCAGGHSGGDQG